MIHNFDAIDFCTSYNLKRTSLHWCKSFLRIIYLGSVKIFVLEMLKIMFSQTSQLHK